MEGSADKKAVMKFKFIGILDDKHRRGVQLRVICKYLLGLECLIAILIALYVFSGDKFFVSFLASATTVLIVEIMRY